MCRLPCSSPLSPFSFCDFHVKKKGGTFATMSTEGGFTFQTIFDVYINTFEVARTVANKQTNMKPRYQKTNWNCDGPHPHTHSHTYLHSVCCWPFSAVTHCPSIGSIEREFLHETGSNCLNVEKVKATSSNNYRNTEKLSSNGHTHTDGFCL